MEQQRLEKAASAELEQTASVIKTTGFFKKIDKLYGELPMDQGDSTEGDSGGGGFGDDGADTGGGFGDDSGGGFGDDSGGGFGDAGGDAGGFGESFRGDEDIINRLLLEGKKKNQDISLMTKGIDSLINGEDSETLTD